MTTRTNAQTDRSPTTPTASVNVNESQAAASGSMDGSDDSGRMRPRKRPRFPTSNAQTAAEIRAQREAEQRAKKDARNARRRRRRAEQSAARARARAGLMGATAGDCRENQVGEVPSSRPVSGGSIATGTNGHEKPTLSLRKMKERLKALSPSEQDDGRCRPLNTDHTDNGQHSNNGSAAPEVREVAAIADILLSLQEGSWPEQSSSRPRKRVRIVRPDSDDEEEPLSASAATEAGSSTTASLAPANAAPPVMGALPSSVEEQQLMETARRSALPLLGQLACLVPYWKPYESPLHESYPLEFEENGRVTLAPQRYEVL